MPLSHHAHSQSIDGLRSVAILPVMIGHAFPDLIPGGFLGVDVFFVISGFLITSLMMREIAAKERFDIAAFYKRRILRILPALTVVMVATLVAGFVLLPPFQLRELGQAGFATAIFASNILFWLKSGYFDPAAEENPLVHTWSLAVEEQFYLAAPLLALLALWRLSAALTFLIVLSVGSLVFAEMTNDVVPSTYFFFTLNRLFELGIGAIAAVLMAQSAKWPDIGRLGAHVASVLALAVLAVCFMTFGPGTHHPGLITLLPVLATLTLLVLHQSGSVVHRGLAYAPIVFVGLLSYSLYLWHQPLLAFLRVAVIDYPPVHLKIAALLASGGLAYLTWRFVETPFRQYDRFSLRGTFVKAAGVLGAFAVTGLYFTAGDGLTWRYGERVTTALPPANIEPFVSEQAERPAPAEIMVWGDSHADMLSIPLRQSLRDSGSTVTLYRHGGCPPVPGFDNDWRNLSGPRCSVHNAQVLAELISLPEGTVVVIAARWQNYLQEPYTQDEFGQISTLASRSIFPASDPAWSAFDTVDVVGAALSDAIGQLRDSGKHVVLVGSVPRQPHHGTNLLYKVRGNTEALDMRSTDMAFHRDTTTEAHRLLSAAARANAVTLVDPAQIICGTGACPYLREGRLAYLDDNHLTTWGGLPVVEAILTAIIKAQSDTP